MKTGKHSYNVDAIVVYYPTAGELYIGNFCSIATTLRVFLGGDHATEWITTYPFSQCKTDIFTAPVPYTDRLNYRRNNNVVIGNDVWIGGDVTIMRGVRIGDGAVIARNSHVIRDVPPYAVYGGNPAQFYYMRFSEENIAKLLEIKWWEWDDDEINAMLPVICSNDIDKLYKYYQNEHTTTGL